MKKVLIDRKLTTNFSLYEFIEGVAMPRPSIELNWKTIEEMDSKERDALIERYQLVAKRLQALRNEINKRYKAKNSNVQIGFRITSGYRCVEWEVSKGRGEKSRHSLSAADFFAHNVKDDALYSQIMEDARVILDAQLRELGGLGTYIADLKQQENNIVYKKRPFRFIHMDHEASRATRWNYKAP